jgi:ribosomal protein L19E
MDGHIYLSFAEATLSPNAQKRQTKRQTGKETGKHKQEQANPEATYIRTLRTLRRYDDAPRRQTIDVL